MMEQMGAVTERAPWAHDISSQCTLEPLAAVLDPVQRLNPSSALQCSVPAPLCSSRLWESLDLRHAPLPDLSADRISRILVQDPCTRLTAAALQTMAKPVLIYAAQGDGRAHAVRALAVAQALSEYEVHILSSGQGYDFLKRTGYGHIHEIDGLSAVRGKGGRIDYLRTAWKVVQFFFGLPASIDEVHQRFAALKPEAVIADFEPSVSRWARREGIPYLRLDSQGRFDTFAPPSSLPLALRVYWYAAGLFTRLWMPLSDHKVISVFNHERLHTQDERTSVVNCFLRPELLDAVTKAGEHILVYAKEGMEKALCQSLAEVSGPIRCYGFQPPEDDKRFEKCAISQDAFLEDLLAARLVIYSVGNQINRRSARRRKASDRSSRTIAMGAGDQCDPMRAGRLGQILPPIKA